MKSEFRERFPKTHELLEKARGEVFPDYAVGVSLPGSISGSDDHEWFGFSGCGPLSLFDLASLSKVLSTTTLFAIAEQKKILSIDEPVKSFFSDFPDARVKLSHLLNHTSGLPAWLALHAYFHDENGPGRFDARHSPLEARSRYEFEILKSFDASKFEKEAVYSDLGFLLLGWALEKRTTSLLDALFQEWVVEPTGLDSLQYLPITPDVVPTEDCPWRRRVLRGEVHDDNCFVLGGVAGHAGLFGDIGDVIELARLWLQAFLETEEDTKPFDADLLAPGIARKFWTFSHVPTSTRFLGWDSPSRGAQGPSSTGQFFSNSSRGHLGFTGTSLWIDPEKKLIVSLLTNRVHPSRNNEKIKTFRPLFHDQLLTELGFNKT